MQNLDKIIEKIKSEAAEKAEAVLRQSQEKCDAVIRDAEERAAAVTDGAAARAKRESLATVERAYSAAEMKRREIMLAARVGMINRAFSEAERYLCELSDEDYCVFCGHLLADAVEERLETVRRLRETYGDSDDWCLDFTAVFNSADKESRAETVVKAAKAFLKRKSASLGKTAISVSEDCADISGGLILRYGDIETNCSVSAVVAGEREKCEAKIAAVLFAPDASSGDAGAAQ